MKHALPEKFAIVELPSDFEKGDCYTCPFQYFEINGFDGSDSRCVFSCRYDNCPLEIRTLSKINSSEEVENREVLEKSNEPEMGYWITKGLDSMFGNTCSVCKRSSRVMYKTNFCPNCGKKMDLNHHGYPTDEEWEKHKQSI